MFTNLITHYGTFLNSYACTREKVLLDDDLMYIQNKKRNFCCFSFDFHQHSNMINCF